MAMKLDQKEWRGFFDRLSKSLEGKQAEIDVMSLELGDQIQTKWAPLLGIVYDPKGDMLEVALDELDHMISHPREIFFETGPGGLVSLEVKDAEGAKQLILLKDPLMLPAPHS